MKIRALAFVFALALPLASSYQPAHACGYGAGSYSLTDQVTDAAATYLTHARPQASVRKLVKMDLATGKALVEVGWVSPSRGARAQVLHLARDQAGAWTVVARSRVFRAGNPTV